MDDKSISIIPRNEVHILVTEEDKTGENILAMSDFFGGYVQQLVDAIRTNAVTTYVPSIPVADIGIIGEVVLILSILVDTFISKISLTMQPGPKIDSISGA